MNEQNPNDHQIDIEIMLIDSIIGLVRQNPESENLSSEQVYEVLANATQDLSDKFLMSIEKKIPTWFENPEDPKILVFTHYCQATLNNITTASKTSLIRIIEDRLQKNN